MAIELTRKDGGWQIPFLKNVLKEEPLHWLEVLLDISFVASFLVVALELSQNLTLGGLVAAMTSFLGLWFIWASIASYSDIYGVGRPWQKFFVAVTVVLLFAFAAAAATEDVFAFFALAFAISRFLAAAAWLSERSLSVTAREREKFYAALFSLSGLVVFLSLLFDGGSLLFAAFALEAVVPIVASWRMKRTVLKKKQKMATRYRFLVGGAVVAGAVASLLTLTSFEQASLISFLAAGLFLLTLTLVWALYDIVFQILSRKEVWHESWSLHHLFFTGAVLVYAASASLLVFPVEGGESGLAFLAASAGVMLAILAVVEVAEWRKEAVKQAMFASVFLKLLGASFISSVLLFSFSLHLFELLLLIVVVLFIEVFQGKKAQKYLV